MSSPRVLVVGAGVGGLASALELAASGMDVTVLERAASVGGKMRRVAVNGLSMDAGPTVFTMRWVFDELFDDVGASLSDHLTLQPLSVLARHAWDAGEWLDLHAEVAASADAIGRFAGAAAARGYLAFAERTRRIYNALEKPFLRAARPNPLSLVGRAGWRGLPGLAQISPFITLWNGLGRYFPDPRLRQMFGRYATYCGSSPFAAPATLMLVAHAEQQGVWQVEGGMHRVSQALSALAVTRGASIRCHAEVRRIRTRGGRVCGVQLLGGEEIPADAVVFNGDAAALPSLVGLERAVVAARAGHTRSLSALTWNLVATTAGFPLSHHTAFFSADCRQEFKDLQRGRLPAAPTVYVCAQDRSEADAAARRVGAERLLLVVNAPAAGDQPPFTAEELARCERRSFDLMARCGLRLHCPADSRLMTTPNDFAKMFPATGGALYGPASHGWMASFQRPGARSPIPGLYLAGGSVHPGPGVPMAALSGRQAAASVLADAPAHRLRWASN